VPREAWPEVARVADLVSFEPAKIDIYLDDKRLALPPGQTVMPHAIDRGLDPDEIVHRAVAVTPALGPLPPLVRSRLDSKPEH
jgi:hypothetical protein